MKEIAKHRDYPRALIAKRKYSPRAKKYTDQEFAQILVAVPLAQRQTLRALEDATSIPIDTLHCYIRSKLLRRYISRAKPKLTPDHKNRRLAWALGHVERPLGNLCYKT
ncbi:hypothetical protein PC129_g21696 [Phytophthora cactorum]|nr:hypothetical protein PC129_g21696 [Phytophthora cactorum]